MDDYVVRKDYFDKYFGSVTILTLFFFEILNSKLFIQRKS